MNDTQRLRMLINRVDAIMQRISCDAYVSKGQIRIALREALQKTGRWVH